MQPLGRDDKRKEARRIVYVWCHRLYPLFKGPRFGRGATSSIRSRGASEVTVGSLAGRKDGRTGAYFRTQKEDAKLGRQIQAQGGPRERIRMTYSPFSTLQRYVPVEGGAHLLQGLGTSELMVRRITGPGLRWNAEASFRRRAIRKLPPRPGAGTRPRTRPDEEDQLSIWVVCFCFLFKGHRRRNAADLQQVWASIGSGKRRLTPLPRHGLVMSQSPLFGMADAARIVGSSPSSHLYEWGTSIQE